MVPCVPGAAFFYHSQKAACQFADPIRIPHANRFPGNQIFSNAESGRSGVNELEGGLLSDAA